MTTPPNQPPGPGRRRSDRHRADARPDERADADKPSFYDPPRGHAAPAEADRVTAKIEKVRLDAQREADEAKLSRSPLLIVIAVGLVIALALVIVGVVRRLPDAAQSEGQSATAATAINRVAVSGRVGATPTVTVRAQLHATGVKSRVVTEGKGREIVAESPVLLAITSFDAQGNLLSATGYPEIRTAAATPEELGTSLEPVIVGQKEGTRLVFLRNLDHATTESEIEIDVIDILPTSASGPKQEPADPGPLHVTMGEEGPSVTHEGDVPSSVVTQVLQRGEGEQVGADDRIVAQYIVVRWSDGVVRSNTWSQGIPQVVDISAAMPGLRTALTDRTVGSRVAVTIPVDQATGSDTLCAVVDILAIDHQSTDGEQSGG